MVCGGNEFDLRGKRDIVSVDRACETAFLDGFRRRSGDRLWVGHGTPAVSGGETRTLSLYHVHTKESLTITYKVNGRYIPSALRRSTI